MIKVIKVSEVKIGMHLIIPDKWLNRPFRNKEFFVGTAEDLQLVRESGYSLFETDTEKGLPLEDYEQIGHANACRPGCKRWNAEDLLPETLCVTLQDDSLPHAARAEAVYTSSLIMMERLFDDPRAENIKTAKEGISGIVDLLLTRDDVASLMLRITDHDFSTYTHSVNVGLLGAVLSKRLYQNSDDHNLHELAAGFFFHDLGKVNIDPAIITKPGRLDEEEMRKMRMHPGLSYKLLLDASQLSEECRIIAVEHHEREDGTGYPRRLKGDEIHMYARICCIADVYDALTAKRSYKPQLTPFEALKIMKEEMLQHFHKDLFEQFVMMLTESHGGRV